MSPKPPKLVLQFFRWFCRKDLRYHIEGDLIEFFEENVKEKGIKEARKIFTMEVMNLIRPRMIRFLYSGLKLNFLGMSKLNFLVAIRRLYRNRTQSLINISGLTIGLVSIMLMMLYINFETTYDNFDNDVYRIERKYESEKINETWDNTPYPLAMELVNKVPTIEMAANARRTSNYLVVDEVVVQEKNGLYADPEFLEMFPFQMSQGDAKTALKDPMSIILSKSLAHKLFPNGNYLGEIINLDKKDPIVVTGVFDDYQYNSHIIADYIISFNTIPRIGGYNLNNWSSKGSVCYIKLANGSNSFQIEEQISSFMDEYVDPNEFYTESLSLRPVSEVYLNTSKVRGGIGKGSDSTIIYLFYAVVIFTSLITALNYMNSSTAELINRELEIGIKKVMGSSKANFALQFMIEALIVAIIGFILAISITYLVLPYYNMIVNKPLTFNLINQFSFIFKVFMFALGAGILTGLYPTLYLSALKISSLIKGVSSLKRKSVSRKVLVTFQLFVAMPLIFTSILMAEQINFLQTREIGFERSNIARTFISTNNSDESIQSVKQEILKHSDIIDCSISTTGPYQGSNSLNVLWQDDDQKEQVSLRVHGTDYDFIDTYGMKLVDGRNFNENYASDSKNALIINETAVKYFNWDSAIGKVLKSGNTNYKVVGVVKDFNDFTMFKKIPPMAFHLRTEGLRNSLISVKISGNQDKAIDYLNSTFNQRFPEEPIQFELLENEFDRSYFDSLGNVSNMFIFFSVLAIFLAALGLYSLVSYSTKLQQKMIAIRKVLGAKIGGLFALLLREYLVLYAISSVLGLVTTYFIAKQVMGVFAYHTEVKLSFLIIGGTISLAIVLISVSAKILITARANPVDAIGKE